MADGKAFTGTPDLSAGNPVDIAVVQTAVGAVDRQRMVVGDALGINPDLVSALLQKQAQTVDLLERLLAAMEAQNLLLASSTSGGPVATDEVALTLQ